MSALTGTGRLVRLGLRRDRLVLTAWLAALAGLVAVSVASVAGLYTSEAERAAAAAFSAANQLSRALDGPASGSSLGALTMAETFGVLAVLVALMSIQMVVRHTRQDEEAGRAELLGSTVVGRHARLAAALLVAVAANVVVAATATVVLVGQDLPVAGAVAAGAALGAVGVVFAAAAGVTAQLSGSQRGATGLAVVALGVAFLLRAVGDAAGTTVAGGQKVVSAWPSWLSPIGWGQQVRPFSEDLWGVFGLFGGLVAGLVVTSFVLAARRDVGAGLLADRPGPPRAGRGLSGPMGLVWRLQRGTVLAWAVALSTLGAAFGALGDGADELVGLSDELAAAFTDLAGGGSLLDAYFAFVMGFLGVAAAAFTVQTLLRARTEEATGRLEPVLAAGVSRHRWLLAVLTLAGAGTAGVLLLAGMSAAAAYGVATGDLATGLAGFGVAAAVQIPAALALGGFVVAVLGAAPRWVVGVGWAALAASLVAGQLGNVIGLSQPVMNLSPFTHVPTVPAGDLHLGPVAALLAATVVLAGAGWAAFRRRDLAL